MARESGSWEGKIESISHDGYGVGVMLVKQGSRTYRRPIFVPYTAPGDVIRAQITDAKRKYVFGKVEKVIADSAQRVKPKCAHFQEAGKCNLQHVAYEEQLRQKAKQISFLLQRKGVTLPYDITVLPSKQRKNYRWSTNITLLFDGRCIAGYKKHASSDTVEIRKCTLLHEQIQQLLKLLNDEKTTLENLEIEATVIVGERGKIGLLVPVDDIKTERRQAVKEFFESLYARNRKLIGNVFFSENGRTRSYGQVQEHFSYQADDVWFTFLPETPIHANVATNDTFVQKVVELLFTGDTLPQKDIVLDLYSGIGNFSLPIGKKAHAVIGIDGSQACVLAGTTNALRNNIRNVTFRHTPVERYLREYVKRCKRKEHNDLYPKATKVVVSPPSGGLTPTLLKELKETKVQHILYVSRNPVTLANDLHDLQYNLKEIVGVDMHPDTNRVATVALLERP